MRLRSATARMERLPAFLAQARANLVPARVPKIHADTVVGQNKGLHSLVDGIVADGAKLPPADRARLEAAAKTCKAAIDEHQKWLETVLVPAAKGEFRLGAELYDAKLAFALNSPQPRRDQDPGARRNDRPARHHVRDLGQGPGGQARRPPTPKAPPKVSVRPPSRPRSNSPMPRSRPAPSWWRPPRPAWSRPPPSSVKRTSSRSPTIR
uniref:DUF885 family protein n=1 Tax=Phenylobacterium glaciei TaxID=2803784 RepID=A0A974P4C5_9CAUL|nr:DUF885 family protein [Phenylobacterium glaciei]